MITHDVDEAIYLADKIVLMTNGPGAVLAEIVENPLPKSRARIEIHRHPLYYAVRNHIIDFLVSRSRSFTTSPATIRGMCRWCGRASIEQAAVKCRMHRSCAPPARGPELLKSKETPG